MAKVTITKTKQEWEGVLRHMNESVWYKLAANIRHGCERCSGADSNVSIVVNGEQQEETDASTLRWQENECVDYAGENEGGGAWPE